MNKKFVYEILEELIKIDTTNPPGNEKRAAEYLYELFTINNIDAEIQELGENKANLIASYGEGEPEVVFCGHLDVVPTTKDWHYPPFQLTRAGERLYGRGTADMKGGIAAMCSALIKLAQENVRIKGKLTLVFVADEECSNQGMKHFLEKKASPLFAVIGEPTELQVAIAHRGVVRDYVDIIAPPYHAALPARQCNAMQSAAEAVDSIFRLNEKLKFYNHEVLPAPSIAVTMIKGYENDNIVPGHVRLLTDFRILPKMSYKECRELEEKALSHIGECRISKHFFLPGGEISSSNEFVKKCCKIGEQILEREQSPVAFDASCEQCFLIKQGIPTIICGPGSLKQAHTIDEYIEEEQIQLAEKYYLSIAKEFLNGDR